MAQLLTGAQVDQFKLDMLIPHYLMSSYLYEHENVVYMVDGAYDNLCRRLYSHFDEIQHQHKHLIQRDALTATTGYYLRKEQYPCIVRDAAIKLAALSRDHRLYDEFVKAGLIKEEQ